MRSGLGGGVGWPGGWPHLQGFRFYSKSWDERFAWGRLPDCLYETVSRYQCRTKVLEVAYYISMATHCQPSLPGPQYVVWSNPELSRLELAARREATATFNTVWQPALVYTFGADVAKLNTRFFSLSTTHSLAFRS